MTVTGDPAQFASKTVGSNVPVTVANLVLGGTTAGNYQLTNTTAVTSANITSATLTVSGITANSKVYNGTTSASLNTGGATLVGVLGGDNVTLDTSLATGAFLDKTVALLKTVNVSGLAIAGNDAGNYTLVQPTTTASIAAAPVTAGFTDRR